MPSLTVNHLTDSAFLIDVRGHTLVIDEPDRTGDARGATATEMFLSGLAGCVASTVVAYLRSHYQPHDGVRVECEWRTTPAPQPRIEAIRMRVLLPRDPDRDTYLGIIDAFNRCPARFASRAPIAIELRSFAEWASLTASDPIGRTASPV